MPSSRELGVLFGWSGAIHTNTSPPQVHNNHRHECPRARQESVRQTRGAWAALGENSPLLSQAPWCHCPAVLVPCLTALCRPGAPQGSSLCMGMDQTRRPSPEPCHECRHLRACIWGRLRSRAFILKGLMNLPACLPTYQPACLELSAKLRLVTKIR